MWHFIQILNFKSFNCFAAIFVQKTISKTSTLKFKQQIARQLVIQNDDEIKTNPLFLFQFNYNDN